MPMGFVVFVDGMSDQRYQFLKHESNRHVVLLLVDIDIWFNINLMRVILCRQHICLPQKHDNNDSLIPKCTR